MRELRGAIPERCFRPNLAISLAYAAMSVGLTIGSAVLAWRFIPLDWRAAPLWIAYAIVCGTFAIGAWVIAHECGHGAFSTDQRVCDTVGFVLHSALLVPYFSWQRSHGIHHAKTNHVIEGETHVPPRLEHPSGAESPPDRGNVVEPVRTSFIVFGRLLFGWPMYLLFGTTGGPERGTTSHFWPFRPFSRALFPSRLNRKVLASSAGVATTIGLLIWWTAAAGTPWAPILFYVGPYLVCNAWLVGYTWLQHTNHDIPHYDETEWSFVRGAFCSVDRPYGVVFDTLHHRIGSTHVAHHICASIPHYRAAEATAAIEQAYPDLYRYDPTGVPLALWRAGADCVAVQQSTDGWRFRQLGDVNAR
jgi:fatty acid desaturase